MAGAAEYVKVESMLPLYTLKRTRFKGIGAFATVDIPKGLTVMECPFVSYLEHLYHDALQHYVFTYPYTVKGEPTEFSHQSAMVFGDASMLNHSDQPNCAWDWLPRRRLHRTKAIQPIKRGEELTFDYGWDVSIWDGVGGKK